MVKGPAIKASGRDISPNPPVLSVVVPCYNEEAVLEELLRRLMPCCESVVGNDFEVVLVDDGSQDRTRTMVKEVAQEEPRIVAVLLSRNHGHQLALTAGLSISRGERIFVLDADLQDPPELLATMMSKMDEGYDVVYGKRSSREGESAFKRASARAFYRFMSRLVEFDIPLDTGDFRLMSRRVANVLNDMPERHRFIRGMVSWAGYPQIGVEYDRDARFAGETKYPLRKMLSFAVDAVTSFSTVPLRMATWLGLSIGVLSVCLIVYSLVVWAGGTTVPGWTSLTMLVLLLGGVQMVTIGVIGEYLGRLYMESKARPIFLIDEIVRTRENIQTTDLVKQGRDELD